MSGRRGRRAVFAGDEPGRRARIVPKLGPVVFTVGFRDGEHTIDWSALPCPKLARAARPGADGDGRPGRDHPVLAVLPQRRRLCPGLRPDGRRGRGRPARPGLGDLTAGHVDAFEDKLTARYPAGARDPLRRDGLPGADTAPRRRERARPARPRPGGADRLHQRQDRQAGQHAAGRLPPAGVRGHHRGGPVGRAGHRAPHHRAGRNSRAAGRTRSWRAGGTRPTSRGTSPATAR